MPRSRPTKRHAYRPRWRPASSSRGSPPKSGRAELPPIHHAERQSRALLPASKPTRSTPMAHSAYGRTTAKAGSGRGQPHQSAGADRGTPTAPPTAISPATLGLPQLFSPEQAVEILRGLGLTEITECALRTRAYRRQIPFHLNGRQIRFTIGDLREIAEGQARRPNPPGPPHPAPATAPRAAPAARRSSTRAAAPSPITRAAAPSPIRWRARESSNKPTPSHETPQ
jgi:hypothetical protein